MGEPIVFISKHSIKAGKLDELSQYTKEGMLALEASKPGTVFQYAYVNPDGSEVSFIHVFPDAAAMEDHLIGANDRADKAYEMIEPISMEIFGSPGEKVLLMFRQLEARGIAFTLRPQNLGGFIRLSATE
jgi:hypothetical protein